MASNGNDPRNEIFRQISERVEQQKSDVMKMEEEWPDAVKEACNSCLNEIASLLDTNATHTDPIIDRVCEARGKLTILIAALSGISIPELLKTELESALVAAAIGMVLDDDNG